MAEETNVQSTGSITAPEQEKTFTQAELDRAIQNRLDRERKKFPSEEEMNAYRNWKDDRAAEQKRERDLAQAQADLAEKSSELEQLKREKYVLSKGLTGDDAEFIAFKAAKLVDDKTTFEQAVDQLTENRAKARFDWSAPVGGGTKAENENATMNSLIRGALK